jgi:peroxiredoxin
MGFGIGIGDKAPDFSLCGVDGKNYSLEDFKDRDILVVVFTCNHCPYVIGSEDRMIRFYKEYAPKGVGMVGINSNETDNHPGDTFDNMVARAKERGFEWPYLRDESQDVAKAYGAMKTPHYFVFDSDRILRYKGRMDDNPKNESAAETNELRQAVDELLEGGEVSIPETEPIGCNVKWWGKAEHWMPADACDFLPGSS